MTITYHSELHQQLIDGKRMAVAWGLSRDASIQLKRAPYEFHAIVDGRAKPEMAPRTFENLPVVSPSFLQQFAPQDIVVVVFADVKSFGSEIAEQIQQLGSYDATTPIDYWQNFPFEMMQQRYEKAIASSEVTVTHQPTDIILLCIHKLCKGGAEKQLVWLALGLRELGYQVALMTFLPDEPDTTKWSEQLAKAGVSRILPAPMDAASVYARLDNLGIDRAFHTIYSGFYLNAFVSLTAYLQQQQPLVAISFLDGINVTLATACRLTGFNRAIFSGRNYAPVEIPNLVSTINLDAVKAVYLDVIAHKTGLISCNSSPGAVSYAQWLGLQAHCVSVIHNYLKIEPFSPVDLRKQLGLPASARVVCGVMRLAVEKRPDLFIEVFAKVAANIDDIYAVIFGEGYLRSELEKRIQSHCLTDRVFLMGTVESAIPYMADCDALMHTAVIEGMPNVIMEAMALQLPVFAYDIPAITAIAKPTASLSLSPVENVDMMASQLQSTCSLFRQPTRAAVSGSEDSLTDYANKYMQLASSFEGFSVPAINKGYL